MPRTSLVRRRQQQRDAGRGGIMNMRNMIALFLVLVTSCYAVGFFLILGAGATKESPVTSNTNDNAGATANAPAKVDSSPQPPPPPQNDAVRKKNTTPANATVGFAVTITGCGSDPITEGAAVLKHAIHLASVHGNLGGRYDYKMYAIYHPDGYRCTAPLKDLGYTLIKRETPVAVKDIQGEFLRENIEKNGCCGERELVKLEAYTLTEHPVVVHLDLDVMVLKPLDALFDMMLAGPEAIKAGYDTSEIPIMWPDKEIPQKVNAFFTRDYNMVNPSSKYKPVQGGFLVLRPDINVYNEFVAIIKKGDFRRGHGWGGLVGPFYGSMTFQGLIPYYYDVLHENESIELSRCIYNQMADNPKDKRTVNDIPQGKCRTNQEECEDCRNRPIEDVVTAHFTLCQKPWLCLPQDHDIIQQRLCHKLHHEWYRIRRDLERSWGRSGEGNGTYHSDHFFGHCTRLGKEGYMPIAMPYGGPAVASSQ